MATKTGKSRKQDRNRPWCEAYRLRDQRGINKARALTEHLARFPADKAARATLDSISPDTRKRGAKLANPNAAAHAPQRRWPDDMTRTAWLHKKRGAAPSKKAA